MTAGKAGGLALLCSFAVYFIPVVGPHAAFFIFETIRLQFRDFTNPAWAFSALGAAVGLQTVAVALFYWFWRRRSVLSIAALPAYGLAAAVLAQFIYMLWLPSYFLIEADQAPETGAWMEACTVADASMMTWRTPRRLPHDGWGEVWLSDSQNRQSMLSMPGCRRIAAPLPQPQLQPSGHMDFSVGIVQIAPGGLALVQRTDIPSNKSTWYLLNAPAGALLPLSAPAVDGAVAPYLSDDGSQIAWILPIPGTGPPVRDALHLRPVLDGKPEAVLDLSPFGAASYETIGIDSTSGEILLWVNVPARLLATTMDGSERSTPALPALVKPQSNTLVLTEHGVLAWDAYKEDDNYLVAWSMNSGSGSRRIPRGSSVEAAAVDPSARYVAISTSTSLNIGNVRDSVVVLRTSDGKEVFRRFLPKYSRTNVAFVGRDFFAYSDTGSTHVLRLPTGQER
jgi:hypothetical protein